MELPRLLLVAVSVGLGVLLLVLRLHPALRR
jgi:hypothetical protein